RRLRGDAAGAATAYAAARQLGIDPQPGPALLTAAAGDAPAALAQIHDTLATRRRFEGSRQLLAGVQLAVQVGSRTEATTFTERLAATAAPHRPPGPPARAPA